MNSVCRVSKEVNAENDFYLLLGDFLDEFYQAPADIKTQMICESPQDMDKRECVPFLASMVHKLANDNGLKPPHWVFEKRCYLSGKNPYFACNVKSKLRLLFMYKSPPEFKHRNLFVDENVLARV